MKRIIVTVLLTFALTLTYAARIKVAEIALSPGFDTLQLLSAAGRLNASMVVARPVVVSGRDRGSLMARLSGALEMYSYFGRSSSKTDQGVLLFTKESMQSASNADENIDVVIRARNKNTLHISIPEDGLNIRSAVTGEIACSGKSKIKRYVGFQVRVTKYKIKR